MSNNKRILAENICIGFSVLLIAICISGCGSDSPSGPDDPDNSILGATWTVRTPSAIDGMDDICWAGNKFVAVGTSSPNLPAVSADGVTWQSISGTFDAQNVDFFNGHIVAGEYNMLFHSLNGISWDTIHVVQGADTFLVRTYSHGLFTDNNGFVAWAYDKTQTNTYLVKSNDGVSWSISPEPSPMWYRQSRATTTGSTVEVGTDGTVRQNGSVVNGLSGFEDVVYTGSGFVMVGQNGSAKSNDGVTWTEYPSLELNRLTFTGTLFFALGPQEGDSSIIRTVYTSSDAIAWTQKYRDDDGPWGLSPRIIYGVNRIIIARQDGGILTSP